MVEKYDGVRCDGLIWLLHYSSSDVQRLLTLPKLLPPILILGHTVFFYVLSLF